METQLLINDNGLCYSKNKLITLPNSEEIKTAEAWIKIKCHHIKSINRRIGSYSLKHRAEEFGELMNKHFGTDIFMAYVSNGAFIQAALNLGYEPIPEDYNSPNAYFRMGVKLPMPY